MSSRRSRAKVGVVILNYNCSDILRDCVTSVLHQSREGIWTCIVDNGSEDGSVEMAQEAFPTVRLVETGRNIGFAGLNIGITLALEAGCDYIMYLDSDAKLEGTAVDELASYLDHHHRCGIAGPQQFRYTTGEPYFLGARLDLRTLMFSWIATSDQPVECDYLGNSLIRSEIFRTLRFDERFFTYYADTDFCLRAKGLGYTVVGVPSSKIYSMQSYTSSIIPGLRGFIPARNRLLFLSKHTPRRYWPVAVPLAIVDSASRLGYWVIRRQFLNAAFVLIGLGSGFMFLTGGSEPALWRSLAMGGMDNKVVISGMEAGDC